MRSLFPFIGLMLNQRGLLLLGMLLGFITLLAGLGLLSLSGWFIAAAGFAGLSAVSAAAFNYFIPGSGVRLFSMIRIASRYGERVFAHEATFKILTTLRVWIYKHLEPLAPAHLLRYHSGDLLSRLISDVDAMDNLYIRVLTPILLALLIAFVLLAFLYLVNVQLAWLVFLSLVFSGLIAPLLAFLMGNKPGKQIQKSISRLRIKLVGYMQGMVELILFAADEHQLKMIAASSDALIRLQAKMAFIKGSAIALITLATGVTIWLVLFFGVALVHTGFLNGALLALVVLAIFSAFEAILPILLAFQYLGKTITAANRLLKIANTKPYVNFISQSKSVISNAGIVFKNIEFAYEGRHAVLKGFNLAIKSGEKVGIVGPTGVGKTTLIHLLSRSWDPQFGNIYIGGVNLRELSESDLRSAMTIISQQPYLFNSTIRDNLLLAKPKATDDELFDALRKVQLKAFINGLPKGLNTWAGEAGLRFSGGQIRRMAVARAILHDAPIWIFDEPTEGLDSITRSNMLIELHSLMANKTVIIISHRLSDLVNVDRVVELNK